MPFVSDAQRKHFYANKGGDSSSDGGLSFGDLNDTDISELRASWQSMGEEGMTNGEARERGFDVQMPQMTQSEKVDWAAYRGDFGKK